MWYWRGPNGEYEFYDNPGFHPRTGEALAVITSEAIASWKESMKQSQLEEAKRRAALEREQRARQEQQEIEEQRRAAEQEREQQAIASCDQMAANPADVRKPADVPGAPYDALKANSKAAAEACALAMKVNPGEIRYRYQYARSLEIDDPRRAFKIHEQLVREGYLASYDNAGSILIDTYKNIPEEIKYFKEGTRRGDPDSMVSLAGLIERHYVIENNPEAVRYALLSRAAELGHPGAQLALEKEREKFQELQQQRQFQQQQQQLILQLLGTIVQGIPHR